jgi:V8-like Glu-specific endopeptidase
MVRRRFPATKVFLTVLAVVYTAYLVGLGNFMYSSVFSPPTVEHELNVSASAELAYWTPENMRNAVEADQVTESASNLDQTSSDVSKGSPEMKQGQAPRDTSVSYPLSTVGKLFMRSASGMNMVCSGTSIISNNRSTVDTAGHCLYWNREWVQTVIFCPLYDNGNIPFGCWAATDLEVPSDWLDARPNDLHHDFGMAVVAANGQERLSDLVGSAGWAYNQRIEQPFYAYGYPAAYPFDGQTRQSCAEGSTGRSWQHAGGTVISIPCNMTGGSSGGPWYMKQGNNWYVNGHNDFISSLMPKHMFSPYYDDTWHALYEKAQNVSV